MYVAPMTATAQLLDTARAVGEVAVSHRAQAERDRRLPDAVMDELVGSGLLRLLRSRRLGGLESDPRTYVEVIRELSRHDLSAGWIYGVLGIHEWYMSYVEPALQQEIYGPDHDAIVVDSLAPVGTAEPVEGGHLVSGTWKFVSGVEWCSWAAVTAVGPLPDGDVPEPCFYFVPRAEFTVRDEWKVVGLRGTASNTVVVDRVFVPEHRRMPLARVAASGRPQCEVLDDGPLYRVPFVPMLAAAIFPAPLGGAQQALDAYRTWTEGRVRPYSMGAQEREAPAAQFTLAECSARWDAAHALSLRYADEVYRLGQEGRSALDDVERARFFAWRGHIGRTSADIADRLFQESGGNAIFEDHPMQQAWRDTHAAAQHVSLVYTDAMTSYGRTQMGLPGHPML
jgi:3-hydroxy-9,10-secoandrosta-1,3,5(10)-triene-9,17-dione monooxygenase